MKFVRDPGRTGGVGDPEQSDLERRMQDAVKFGVIHEVDLERKPPGYRVLFGDESDEDNHIVTDWIPAGGGRAKGDSEAHFLEKGEKVVMLAEGGDFATGHVMPAGRFTGKGEDEQPATTKPGVWRKRFKNGAAVGYNRDTGELSLDATGSGKVTVRGKDGVIRIADGKMTVQTGAKAKDTGPTFEGKKQNEEPDEGKADEPNFDLNKQMKGLHARVEQLEHTAAAQHFATSMLHNLLLPKNPQIASLLSIFNQAPGGMEKMIDAVTGMLPGYATTLLTLATGKFQAPTLDGIGGLLGGFMESLIAQVQASIESTAAEVAAIPGKIAALSDDLDAAKELLASLPPTVTTPGANGQGGSTSANPEATAQAAVVAALAGQIADLQNSPLPQALADFKTKLASLVASAPASGDFIGSQENITKGMIESVRFGGLGKQS